MRLVTITYKNGEKKQYLAQKYEVWDNGSLFFLRLADTLIWINMSEIKEVSVDLPEEKK
jgi:DNA-binding transcriptional regulator GbsR (MarR family)